MKTLLLALAAILIWSTLALLSSQMAQVPSFLLLGITLGLSGLVSLFRRKAWQAPLATLAVGVGGIFGYHFLLFRAFALAPAVEANLINYLWPLLIVVLSPLLLPAYRLLPRHLVGTLLGLAGVGLIVSGGKFSLQMEYLPGYLLAGGAAVTWAVYSLLTKRLPPFETDTVAAFCLLSGGLALVFYFATGGSLNEVFTLSIKDWFFLVLIAVGPLGAAFFFWNAALKRGDPRKIGALAYLTPLLSTLNLVIFAGKPFTLVSLGAMALIVIGAVVGSWEGRTAKQKAPAYSRHARA